MSRKAHTKSRGGCVECKRRHTKCDETRPQCIKCSLSGQDCVFQSHPTQGGSGARPGMLLGPPALISKGSTTSPPANMLHAELFHFLLTETLPSLEHDSKIATDFTPTIIRHALQTPYLLNGLLSLSALHLSHTFPAKRSHYHFHATHLQTHAISLFNKTDTILSPANCAPIFLFSSVLGTQLLSETFTFRDNDLITFLNRFVQSTRLLRAVRTVAGQAEAALDESDLAGMWRHGVSPPSAPLRLRDDYANLKDKIVASKLGSPLTETYINTIECLQSVVGYEDSVRPLSRAVLAWPVLVPQGYVECLALRRPESLVILAHYAVMLHLHRDVWIFGDSGEFLINSITTYLGLEWESWMDWPRRALES